MSSMIWINDKAGIHSQTVTLPNHWQGETGCVVGPFSNHAVAQMFAMTYVTFRQLDAVMETIFSYQDDWYIKIRPIVN